MSARIHTSGRHHELSTRAPLSQSQRDRMGPVLPMATTRQVRAASVHPMWTRRPWTEAIRDGAVCGAIITFTGVALVVACAALGG